MPQSFVALQGSAHGYAFVRGAVSAQDSVVRTLRAMNRPLRSIIRLTCSITVDGYMVAPNGMMVVALGYSREELEGAPVGALLRPAENIHETEADIFRKFEAVRRGESGQESFSSWMQAKGGGRVYVESTVSWSEAFNRWDVVAEVDTERLPASPQFATPLERIPMLEWLVSRQQDRLRDLARQIAHQDIITVLSTAQERQLRAVAQNVVQEALLEFEDGHVVPLKKPDTAPRGGAPRKFTDEHEVARQTAAIMASADDFWGITVADVLAGLRPPLRSRNSLIGYLIKAGCMREGDSLKDTLRRLGQEALQRLTMISMAVITVGVNLTF